MHQDLKTTPYILQTDPSDLHDLSVVRLTNGDLSFHSNSRGTMVCSPSMAKSLAYGILAVLSGNFDLACTEIHLEVALAALEREARIAQRSSSSKPELDQL